MPDRDGTPIISIPWAMQMKAVSMEEPSRLVPVLTGAILGCGGWVLSRGANDTGTVNMLFEFERQACVEIYTMLIAAGSVRRAASTAHAGPGRRLASSSSNAMRKLVSSSSMLRTVYAAAQHLCL